jgi:hypothetical protein
MPVTSGRKSTKHINDVAQLLSQAVDVRMSPRQADELIDEISQPLWAVSTLDPEAEHLLKHSNYVANLAAQVQG